MVPTLQNDVEHGTSRIGEPVQQIQSQLKHRKKFISQFSPKSAKLLLFTIFFISLIGLFFTILAREDQILLNPILLFSHSWTFLFAPLIIIYENANLKSYVKTQVFKVLKYFSCIYSFFSTNNQIYPIVV